MIPEAVAWQAIALAEKGATVSQIARHLGHDRKTIRIYLGGRRAPGQSRARADNCAPFAAYLEQRTHDDIHLRGQGLHHEITGLGYAGSYPTFTRELRGRGIIAACQSCQTGQPWQPAAARPALLPGPLPFRVAPISGETLSSYLSRVAAAAHLPLSGITGVLPRCLAIRAAACDDIGRPGQIRPGDVTVLAALTGITETALTHALPALTPWRDSWRPPVRAATACHRCAARHGQRDPVPVHLPAWQRACARHHIWLGRDLQIDLTAVPAVTAASRHAARLASLHGTTALVLAETIARQQAMNRPPALARAVALALARPGLDPGHPDTAQAAAYPETIKAAAAIFRAAALRAESNDTT